MIIKKEVKGDTRKHTYMSVQIIIGIISKIYQLNTLIMTFSYNWHRKESPYYKNVTTPLIMMDIVQLT